MREGPSAVTVHSVELQALTAEEAMATHSSILGESQEQRGLVGYSPEGCKELNTTEAT